MTRIMAICASSCRHPGCASNTIRPATAPAPRRRTTSSPLISPRANLSRAQRRKTKFDFQTALTPGCQLAYLDAAKASDARNKRAGFNQHINASPAIDAANDVIEVEKHPALVRLYLNSGRFLMSEKCQRTKP